MLRKILAALFLTVAVSLLLHLIGLPRFGSLGFLIWINCLHIFLFIAYQHQTHYIRQAWGTTISLMAIMAALIGLFRADPNIQILLSITSLSLSLLAFYMFALTHGTLGSMYELMLIPINIFVGIFNGIHHIIVSYTPRIFFPTFTLLIVILGVFSVFLPPYPLLPTINFLGYFNLNLITVGFLIFYVGFLLANVRIQNSLHSHINPQFWNEISRETLVLVCLGIIFILGYFVFRFPNWFMFENISLNTQSQIQASLYRNILELSLIGLILYLITGISLTVLRFNQKEFNALRFSQIGLLILFLSFFIGIFKKFWDLISEYGISPTYIYLLLILLFTVCLTILLIFRFIRKKYLGWHIIEFVTVITFIFLIGMVNVEDLFIKGMEKNLINLRNEKKSTLSQLSPDAVNGWIISYEYAKDILINLPIQDLKNLSDKNKNEIKEAQLILSNLRQKYLKLANRYGNSETITQIAYLDHNRQQQISNNILIQMANANVSEWYAYQKINEEISAKELAKLEETAIQIVSFINQNSVGN